MFELGNFQALAVVAAVTTIVLLRGALGRHRRQAESVPTSIVAGSAPSAHEARRMMVEIHDLARDTQAQLDNKIALLQHLIHEADERIARLEELAAQSIGCKEGG